MKGTSQDPDFKYSQDGRRLMGGKLLKTDSELLPY